MRSWCRPGAWCGLVLAVGLALTGTGCARAEPDPSPDTPAEPPPWHLPAFDGQHPTPEREQPPAGQLDPVPALDARALYDLVLTCYPTRSWWRPELALQARAEDRRRTDHDQALQTAESGSHVALVLRVPLYSAVELDRERERERNRREEMAKSVGALEKLLAERSVLRRELALWQSIENRSGRRVAAGVATTDEQINAITKVAGLEGRLRQIAAELTAQSLLMIGQCDNRADVEAVLAKTIEARP